MKASLKTIASGMKVKEVASPPSPKAAPEKSYAIAATRSATRQVSGHYPAADVHAFRGRVPKQHRASACQAVGADHTPADHAVIPRGQIQRHVRSPFRFIKRPVGH